MSNELAVFSTPGDLAKYLERGKSAVAMALPKHLNPDRMLRLALTCFSTTPKLRQCTGQSILSSIVVASQIGLEPGVAGQGYLIPYKQTCTFVPGWQGLVGLLNNSGRATAWTGAVFDGDVFDFQLGSAPRCVHVPGDNFGDPAKITWVYACGKVNGSEQPVIEAWPASRVWKHRDRFNKVGQQHYSYQHPEMYARKVVLLQVLKYMPRSIELNNAITAANAAEIGSGTIVDGGVVIEVPSEVVDQDAPKFVSKPEPPAGDAPKPEPKKKPEPPTTLQKLQRLAKAADVTDEQLLAFFASQGELWESLADVPEEVLVKIVSGWVDMLPLIKPAAPAEGEAGSRPEREQQREIPAEIPVETDDLIQYIENECVRRDIDKSDLLAWAKAAPRKWAGAATRISEMGNTGLGKLARALDLAVADIGG